MMALKVIGDPVAAQRVLKKNVAHGQVIPIERGREQDAVELADGHPDLVEIVGAGMYRPRSNKMLRKTMATRGK